MRSNLHFQTAVVAFSLLVAGCSDSNLIGPENQLEVTNEAGTFQWQVTALEGVSQTLTYTWTNPGTVADVNQASSVSSGRATLRIADAADVEVYNSDLSQNGTFQTDSSASGAWTVVVTLEEATGTLNFRLQTP